MVKGATRRTMFRWLPFVVVLAVNTALSLSSSVTQWWAVESTPATSRLPAAADGVLEARSNSSNADVHVVLWFVAAVALVWAIRPHAWRRLTTVGVALWVYTGVLEVLQRWVPTRTSQWIDLVGNGVGILAGLATGYGALAIVRRCRRPSTSSPTLLTSDVSAR